MQRHLWLTIYIVLICTLLLTCWCRCDLTGIDMKKAKDLKENSYLPHQRKWLYHDKKKVSYAWKGSFFFSLCKIDLKYNIQYQSLPVYYLEYNHLGIVKNWEVLPRGCLGWNNLQIHAWVNPGAQGIVIVNQVYKQWQAIKEQHIMCQIGAIKIHWWKLILHWGLVSRCEYASHK